MRSLSEQPFRLRLVSSVSEAIVSRSALVSALSEITSVCVFLSYFSPAMVTEFSSSSPPSSCARYSSSSVPASEPLPLAFTQPSRVDTAFV